jgi:alpha-L-fucosidase
MKNPILTTLFSLLAISIVAQDLPKPTQRQLTWQQWETTAFLHFGVNTFTDREWGEGTENPAIFNPTEFDAVKIVTDLKAAGFKLVLITAKHHDGFCLWQTKMTEHSVKNSPYKGGKGDIVGELAAAARDYGLKFGVYLSPWDMHEPSYGTPQYNDFYKAQLRELLTQYGEISEVWFDGAKGKNAKDMSYDFAGYWAIVRELQPKAVMFSDAGPDVRWVGNESGNAGETCWSTLNTEGMAPGIADEKYLNTGDANGKLWIPAETDVSIRKGWFYHPKEDSTVRSPQNLVNLYYKSVGRNSLLLLNIPPDTRGRLHETDVANLKAMRAILDETFKTNLAASGLTNPLKDKDLTSDTPLSSTAAMVVNWGKKTTFDRILIQENITKGQRIEAGKVEFWDGQDWQILSEFTTIGYKRLLRFPPVTSSKIRIHIVKAKTPTVFLGEVGVFKASEKE